MARCSWCYTEGHKKPTCPEYRSYLQRQAEAGSDYHKGLLKPKRRKTRCGYCQLYGHNVKTCAVKQEMTAKITELLPDLERTVRYLAAAQGVERGARYETKYYSWKGGVLLGELKIHADDIVHMIKWGSRNPGLVRSSFMDYTGTKRWTFQQTNDNITDVLTKLTPEQKEKASKYKVDIEYTVDDIVGKMLGWEARDVEVHTNKILSLL